MPYALALMGCCSCRYPSIIVDIIGIIIGVLIFTILIVIVFIHIIAIICIIIGMYPSTIVSWQSED